MKPSRFIRPALFLELRPLLAGSWKALLTSLFLAAAVHLLLATIGTFSHEERALKPLTTKFVKREPRLVKPLELRKRAKPKPRPMRRKILHIEAKFSRREALFSSEPLRVLNSLAKPKPGIQQRSVSWDACLEPTAGSMAISGAKEPKDVVDMSLEMLDIDALDTGRYQAMVIQDPHDKRKIRGFFHMAVGNSVMKRVLPGRDDLRARIVRGQVRLARAMNEYTDIKTDVAGEINIDSDELMKIPWIYIEDRLPFSLTESEARNLGRYLLSGGFLFADDGMCAVGNPGDLSLRQVFKDALAAQGIMHGRDWTFVPIPNDHPIYHCFFDFDDGPPIGADYWNHIIPGDNIPPFCHDHLDGVNIEDRLVGIMSNKDYTEPWGFWEDPKGAWTFLRAWDNTRQLQFGVNLVVFALTQEGSITNRVMNTVK